LIPGKVESKLGDFVSAIKGPFCLSLKRTSFVPTIVSFEETFSLCSLACHVSPFPPLCYYRPNSPWSTSFEIISRHPSFQLKLWWYNSTQGAKVIELNYH